MLQAQVGAACRLHLAALNGLVLGQVFEIELSGYPSLAAHLLTLGLVGGPSLNAWLNHALVLVIPDAVLLHAVLDVAAFLAMHRPHTQLRLGGERTVVEARASAALKHSANALVVNLVVARLSVAETL